jgi:hypothetical protein
MNKTILILFSMVFGALSFHATAQLPGKVQISAQKKHGEVEKGKVGRSGSQAKSSSLQSYVITLQNITQGELKDLRVDYLVFVERQKLGEKKGEETVERVTGTKMVESLGRAPLAFTTDAVTLGTENLVGTFHYKNGGRIRAEDSLIGVWVRISQDGKLAAEYALPTTAINRGWDKK